MDIGISWDIMAANLAVSQSTRSKKCTVSSENKELGDGSKFRTLTISTAKTLKHVEAAWFIVKSAHDRYRSRYRNRCRYRHRYRNRDRM